MKGKDLLLQDISARLSYGVKVLNMAEGANEVCELDSIMTSRKHKDKVFVSLTLPDDSVLTGIEMIKPYLRPMSSMTEEEKREIYEWLVENDVDWFDFSKLRLDEILISFDSSWLLVDWLNAHHFDYRGLIEKGLALAAPEGMYK